MKFASNVNKLFAYDKKGFSITAMCSKLVCTRVLRGSYTTLALDWSVCNTRAIEIRWCLMPYPKN